MKASKLHIKLLSSVVLVGLISQSCEQEEQAPAYVGTWVTEQTITTSTGTTQLRDVLDFSEGSFTNLGQVMDAKTKQWLDFIGVKARITIERNTMNIKVAEMGLATFDIQTGLPVGKIVYFRDGQNEFSTMLKSSQIDKSYSSKFQISGNKLILRTDRNNDGDYNDNNEETVFIRQ